MASMNRSCSDDSSIDSHVSRVSSTITPFTGRPVAGEGGVGVAHGVKVCRSQQRVNWDASFGSRIRSARQWAPSPLLANVVDRKGKGNSFPHSTVGTSSVGLSHPCWHTGPPLASLGLHRRQWSPRRLVDFGRVDRAPSETRITQRRQAAKKRGQIFAAWRLCVRPFQQVRQRTCRTLTSGANNRKRRSEKIGWRISSAPIKPWMNDQPQRSRSDTEKRWAVAVRRRLAAVENLSINSKI
ncbi:hypothetical protein Mal15_68650 [Stieleria maiorica]|uniref:Uncharacterized protein n=1 Tax=Stieleria maiorica TaxID=2795974 RepID=A0A5B9MPA4_9BACT|nr:hypothetical protein Mal15_68650 [Stieleria maiorica]